MRLRYTLCTLLAFTFIFIGAPGHAIEKRRTDEEKQATQAARSLSDKTVLELYLKTLALAAKNDSFAIMFQKDLEKKMEELNNKAASYASSLGKMDTTAFILALLGTTSAALGGIAASDGHDRAVPVFALFISSWGGSGIIKSFEPSSKISSNNSLTQRTEEAAARINAKNLIESRGELPIELQSLSRALNWTAGQEKIFLEALKNRAIGDHITTSKSPVVRSHDPGFPFSPNYSSVSGHIESRWRPRISGEDEGEAILSILTENKLATDDQLKALATIFHLRKTLENYAAAKVFHSHHLDEYRNNNSSIDFKKFDEDRVVLARNQRWLEELVEIFQKVARRAEIRSNADSLKAVQSLEELAAHHLEKIRHINRLIEELGLQP